MFNPYKIFFTVSISLLLTLVKINNASAGFIHQPIAAVTNMDVETGGANATRNQSGLSLGYVSDTTDFDTYIASNPAHNNVGGASLTTFSNSGRIDYDLGGSFLIDGIALWNFTGTDAIRDFTLFSDDESSFLNATIIGTFTATQKASFPNTFSFEPTQASFIRLKVLNTYGGDVFLKEVAFSTTQVPIPPTIFLLLSGVFTLLMRQQNKTHFM